MELATAYIGLGSNLNNPAAQLQSALQALERLPETQRLQCSPWYRSRAIGPGEQPDYINAVAQLRTALSPTKLLTQLQIIEDNHGRQRRVHWGARTLDLDLLLYGNRVLTTDNLQLPHPHLHRRSFVLLPLYDLAPQLQLPNGDSVSDLANQCDKSGLHAITTAKIP